MRTNIKLLKRFFWRHSWKFVLVVAILVWATNGVEVYQQLVGEEKPPPVSSFVSGQATKVATDEFGAFTVHIADDGSLILAGDNRDAGGQDFRLVKLDANSRLDKSFAEGGIVEVDFGGTGDTAISMIVLSDGKILTTGVTNVNVEMDFALARFDASGNLDESFGDGGKVVVDFGGFDDAAISVVEIGGGKIIAGGFAGAPNRTNFALLQLNADGSLDQSFGDGGKATLDFGNNDSLVSMAQTADGKIIAVGNAALGKIAIARFLENGTLDQSFGNGGKTTVVVDGGTNAIVVDSQGRIVVGGSTPEAKLVLVRFLANGFVDKDFGDGGIVKGDFGRATAVLVFSDGRIIVGGDKDFSEGKEKDIVLAAFSEDGSLDKSFGERGVLRVDFDNAQNTVAEMKLAADGNILVAGTTQKDGFTKHGFFQITNEKTVENVKFNLDEEPPKDIKPK